MQYPLSPNNRILNPLLGTSIHPQQSNRKSATDNIQSKQEVSSVYCCFGSGVSDLPKLATGAACSLNHQTIHKPLSFAGTTTGCLALFSVISSIKTGVRGKTQIKNIADFLEDFQNLNDSPEKKSSIDFLNCLLGDINFIQNIPGILSALASALIGIGGVTSLPVTLSGLILGIVDSGCHCVKTADMAQRYQKQIRKILNDYDLPTSFVENLEFEGVLNIPSLVLRSLSKEKYIAVDRFMGSLLTTLGIFIFTILTLCIEGKVHLSDKIEDALSVFAVLLVSGGILISIKRCPYQDLVLRQKEKEKFKKLNTLKRELIRALGDAQYKEDISNEYREILNKESIMSKVFFALIQLGPELLAYATFHIPDTFLNWCKLSAKEFISNRYRSISWENRIEILEKLEPALFQSGIADNEDDLESKFFSKLTSAQHTLGAVMQLMGREALAFGCFDLNPKYSSLFTEKSARQEVISFFQELAALPSYRVPDVAEADFHRYFNFSHDKIKQKMFRTLLKGRFDQYVVFDLKNSSEREFRIYGRILGFMDSLSLEV